MATLDTLPAAYQAACEGIQFPYLYGTPVARRTIEQIEQIDTWQEGHQESRRRHLAMWIWCYRMHNVLYGLGQMSRSRARALSNWQSNPGQFSHPDSSYHVHDPARGLLPVGVDNVGTGNGGQPPDRFNLIHKVAPMFGLRTVSGATERHHTQLAELPGSKRDYNANPSAYRVRVWNDWPALPGTPPPPPKDDDMTADEFKALMRDPEWQYLLQAAIEPAVRLIVEEQVGGKYGPVRDGVDEATAWVVDQLKVEEPAPKA